MIFEPQHRGFYVSAAEYCNCNLRHTMAEIPYNNYDRDLKP